MILSCRDVTVEFDAKRVVDHISFDVEEGEYVCIVGENGSGKSTLLKSILGLVSLKYGSVTFGSQISRKRFGYLPQQNHIQKDFPASVYEVVLSGCLNRCGLRPFYSKSEKQLALAHMKRLSISDLKKCSYSTLSGGQQQRVLLARALCATDKLLLLDEPVTGLDPLVTTELYQLIQQLNDELGVTIIMVSHDIATAAKYAYKILHMNQTLLFYGDTPSYISTNLGKTFIKGS